MVPVIGPELNPWHLQLNVSQEGDVKNLRLRLWKTLGSQSSQYCPRWTIVLILATSYNPPEKLQQQSIIEGTERWITPVVQPWLRRLQSLVVRCAQRDLLPGQHAQSGSLCKERGRNHAISSNLDFLLG